MGAEYFESVGSGNTVQEAFNQAKEEAYYDHGHSGYSGSLAEKDSFKVIPCEMTRIAIEAKIEEFHEDENHFAQDKWGPAGAIKIADNKWVFFGYASS